MGLEDVFDPVGEKMPPRFTGDALALDADVDGMDGADGWGLEVLEQGVDWMVACLF